MSAQRFPGAEMPGVALSPGEQSPHARMQVPSSIRPRRGVRDLPEDGLCCSEGCLAGCSRAPCHGPGVDRADPTRGQGVGHPQPTGPQDRPQLMLTWGRSERPLSQLCPGLSFPFMEQEEACGILLGVAGQAADRGPSGAPHLPRVQQAPRSPSPGARRGVRSCLSGEFIAPPRPGREEMSLVGLFAGR